MVNCAWFVEMIDRYYNLDPIESMEFDRHRKKCSACSEIATRISIAGFEHNLPDPVDSMCLSEETMQRLILGELEPDDESFANAHLESCSECEMNAEVLEEVIALALS